VSVQDNHSQISFARILGKRVEAAFDGGTLTSDSGVLLLREVESKVGIIDRIASVLTDHRHQSYVDHPLVDLLKQRVFQIACGYEDANDCNELRSDPGFKAACDRLPLTGKDLASQPTMSRLENGVRRSALYRIAQAFVDGFILSYETAPDAIILDIDDTDDAVHGAQQLSLFNAYYDEHSFQPLHIYEGQTGKLITTILRPGARPKGPQIVAILKRVVIYLQKAWPNVEIFLRGDSHFSCPEVHDFCEASGVYYGLGQASNSRLKALGQPMMAQAKALHEQTGEPVQLFTSFLYQAKSWVIPRRIIFKAEVTSLGDNPRFVVTNLESSLPSFIYRTIYCARGRMENFIKNHKTFLHSDRTSCHRFQANQFRLFLHSAAYVLIQALAEKGLKGTVWMKAQFNTIQNRILKVAAKVCELKTKIRLYLPSSFPLKHIYAKILINLQRAYP
jgi:hypothetical protein